MTIKEFDKTNLKNLRADVDAAMGNIASKYGIAIRLGNISFLPEKATGKVEFVVTNNTSDGTSVNPREAVMKPDFKRYAHAFGLKPEQYGVIFIFGQERYKLVGLKPRAPKLPVIATNIANGTSYKLPESALIGLQSDDYKKLYGKSSAAPQGSSTCSNDHAFDANWKPIGKCTRPATTTRKSGSGRHARTESFCNECAQLIDESRAEMRAEGRAS